jgi:serine/threonine protein kinase
LAPEIIANKGYEGFASDIWSFGILFYILLLGKVPFKGNNLNELHRNILNGVLPYDEIRKSGASKEAIDLIEKMLQVNVK